MEHNFPSILEPNNLLLWVNTRHPGLSEHAAQPFVIRGFVPCPMCCPHAAKLWFRRKGRGVLCSLCNQLMTKSNFMTQSMLKLLALHNFPHRKPTRFLVTFRVFRGWHITHPKIDLSPALPEETCSLKMSLPLPFKTDITAWGVALPSQPGSCLRINFPPTWRLDFLLGDGREMPIVSKKKRPFIGSSATIALLRQTDFKQKV